jgi:hypothetical protein
MVGRALTDLMMAGHTATMEELPRKVADHAAAVGLDNVAFFLVDLQGRVLRQVTGRHRVPGRHPPGAARRGRTCRRPGRPLRPDP